MFLRKMSKNRRGRSNVFLAACISLISVVATAANYTWNGSSANWESADAYDNGGAKPSASDTVTISANKTATIDDDSAAFVSSLGRVYLADTSSRLIFNLTTNAEFRCEILGNTTIDKLRGKAIQRGDGEVTLAAEGDFVYYTDWEVESGKILKFKQNGANTGTQTYYGRVTVHEGATLFTKYHGRTRVRELLGVGVVTNIATSGSEYLDIYGMETTTPSVFPGLICGRIKVYSRGNFQLTGTNNTFLGECSVYNYNNARTLGIMGLKKIGNQGEASSSGSGDTIFTREYAGCIHYLGEGETTDKEFQFGVSTYRPNEFDAGATGGITFTGKWKEWQSTSTTMSRLVLTGSNTVECVLANEFDTYNNVTRHITKKGSGTWRLAHHPDRKCSGAFTVQDGTLKFDSIAAKGSVCSLGLSSILYQDYTGAKSDDRKVDYALRIGGDTSRTGTLEYAGTAAAFCSTRPLALKGAGRFRVSGGELAFGGVFADDGGGTLIFDAANGATNTLGNITDGTNGTLSIVKEGAGTLSLSGVQDWSGLLDVREGTVIANNHYEYFRLTLKENAYNCPRYIDVATNSAAHKVDTASSAKGSMALTEFGLYAADGTKLNGLLEMVGSGDGQGMTSVSPAALLPGQCAVENGGSFRYYDSPASRRVRQLFDGTCRYDNGINIYKSSSNPTLNDPNTHCKIVIRLAETTTAEVVYYDIAVPRGNNSDYMGRNVTAYSLEGSADGRFWDMIAEDDAVVLPSSYWFGATRTSLSVARGTMLTNLTAVAVATNATLVAKGPVAPIKKLVLDVAGVGTIDGFEFAEDGELEIVGALNDSITIPVTIRNSATFGNVSKWAVFSGGKERDRSVVATDSGITISKRGMVFIVK